MLTGDKRITIGDKQLAAFADFRDNFLGYLHSGLGHLLQRSYSSPGVFGTIAMSADGTDRFKLDSGVEANDGDGHFVLPSSALVSAIYFENSLGVPYEVALRYAEKPGGVMSNPRHGWPEYTSWEETIGERGDPDSVTDLGGSIRVIVDTVTESGVSNAGRKVLVWLVVPDRDASSYSVAVEECTVQWDGSNNYITTSGTLGQTVVSTTVSDYQVLLLGPTVKRNTPLSGSTDRAFIGVVTGAGLGNPPTVFDISGQVEIISSFTGLNDILRLASNGHLKIDVKSFTGESGEDQVRVRNPLSVVKFRVDEEGNVYIGGNLTVEGETTENSHEIVNSDETVTGNLTAGDNAADNHTIKGTWTHLVGTSPCFVVDGTTGHVGIGGTFDASYALNLTGNSQVAGDIIPAATNTYDIGSPTRVWENFYAYNFVLTNSFYPLYDNTADIGSSTYRWRDVYVSDHYYFGDTNAYLLGSATYPAINFDTGDSIQFSRSGNQLQCMIGGTTRTILTDTYLAPNGTMALGQSGSQWATIWGTTIYTGDANFFTAIVSTQPRVYFDATDYVFYDRGANSFGWAIGGTNRAHLSGSVFIPNTDRGLDIGSATYRWDDAYAYYGHLDYLQVVNAVGSHLTPTVTNTYNLGSATNKWATIYCEDISSTSEAYLNYLDVSYVRTNLTPLGPIQDLGTPANRWNVLEVNDAVVQNAVQAETLIGDYLQLNIGAETDLLPATNNNYDLGSTTYRWQDVWAYNLHAYTGLVAGTTTGTFNGILAVNLPIQCYRDSTQNVEFSPGDGTGNYITSNSSSANAKQLNYISKANAVVTAGTTGHYFWLTDTSTATPFVTWRMTMGAKHLTSNGVDSSFLLPGGIGIYTDGSLDVLQLQSGSVTHPFTTEGQTNTFGAFRYYSPNGGVLLRGFCENTGIEAIGLWGFANSENTAAPASARGTISLDVYPAKSAGANIFVLSNGTARQFVVRGNGAIYVNASGGTAFNTATVFDDEQDAVACRDLAYAMAGQWKNVWRYNSKELERMGIMEGSFVNLQNVHALQLGAISELYGILNHVCGKLGIDYEQARLAYRKEALCQ